MILSRVLGFGQNSKDKVFSRERGDFLTGFLAKLFPTSGIDGGVAYVLWFVVFAVIIVVLVLFLVWRGKKQKD